ncbi:MAG: adenylate/guanylate cyclase domain-containing protein [Deltaproteobacteria bacterium]|nr:adenylate/guanylate cyclase domain-containing protein [Deltaproteobacteria bacterium]
MTTFSLAATRDWLLSPECRRLDAAGLVDGLAAELTRAGLPLWRMATSLRTLHPEIWVKNLRWLRGEGAVTTSVPHELSATREYIDNPVARIHGGVDLLRCRLVGAQADLSFPLCAQLAVDGGTDYLILAVPFAGPRTFISFATDDDAGFSDEHIAALVGLVPAVALRAELESEHDARAGLLAVYLGADAAARVMKGAVRRGGGARLHAAIWTCDLRGFTSFSDGATPESVVETLDAYFDCTAGAVLAGGGDVLKFIGDAVLAVFPVTSDADGGERRACRAALAAARDAHARIGKVNDARTARGAPVLEFGVGLHVGDVFYGNIGAGSRLDFTVIGAAVNEAVRVESLSKPLNAPIIMSEAFKSAGDVDDAVSLGAQRLKGVARSVEVFMVPLA